jgi:hypothetical protein
MMFCRELAQIRADSASPEFAQTLAGFADSSPTIFFRELW